MRGVNASLPLSPRMSVRRVQRCVMSFKRVMLVCNQPNALEPSEQEENKHEPPVTRRREGGKDSGDVPE